MVNVHSMMGGSLRQRLKKLSSHQKSCPLADPAERECDVDEHEDVGHGDGQDVAISLSLKLILKTS